MVTTAFVTGSTGPSRNCAFSVRAQLHEQVYYSSRFLASGSHKSRCPFSMRSSSIRRVSLPPRALKPDGFQFARFW
jgi:hypothetical protein